MLAPALILTGCEGETEDRTTLRVISYPWIPDSGEDGYVRLARFIEEDFESKHPDIDLQLRPLLDSFDNYEIEADDGSPGKLAQWLTREPRPSDEHGDAEGYHLVEIDTLLLGDLQERELIAEWPELDTSDWYEAGKEAVTIDGQIYGVPRLLCSHFIISRDPAVTAAGTVDELVQSLDAAGTDRRKLSGTFLGSWNLPALYIDGWRDSHPDGAVATAFGSEPGMIDLDDTVVQQLTTLSERCSFEGENWCLDGTYDDYENLTRAADQLGRNEVVSLFGYSERLHYIIKESNRQGIATDDLSLSLIPMGNGSQPILFADAFVMHRDCQGACQDAAMAFVQYMNEPETHEHIMLSRDAGEGSVPRYVIPATRSALAETALAEDRFYAAIRQQIEGSVAFPNHGFYTVKDAVTCEILSAMGVADMNGC